jgi:hypothetical protein
VYVCVIRGHTHQGRTDRRIKKEIIHVTYIMYTSCCTCMQNVWQATLTAARQQSSSSHQHSSTHLFSTRHQTNKQVTFNSCNHTQTNSFIPTSHTQTNLPQCVTDKAPASHAHHESNISQGVQSIRDPQIPLVVDHRPGHHPSLAIGRQKPHRAEEQSLGIGK